MIRILPYRAVVAVIYSIGVYAISSTPAAVVAGWGFPVAWVELGHVPLFAGWTWVTLWAIVGPPGISTILVATAALVFAAADEWHQSSVRGRVASLADLRSDALGVVLGAAGREAVRRFALLRGGASR